MEKITPGRKLILDLLAKSVAKIQATSAKAERDDIETDTRKTKKKGKPACEISGPKKEITAEDEYAEQDAKSLDVLQLEMKTELLDVDLKDSIKKKSKNFKVEIKAGTEVKNNLLEITVKPLKTLVIEQEARPGNGEIKTEPAGNLNENCSKTKKRIKHKKKRNFFEEAGQEEPIGTKWEPPKVKTEYTESKFKEVDLMTVSNIKHGTSDYERLLKKSCTKKLLEGSTEKLSDQSNVVLREPMEGSIDTKSKHYVKSSKFMQDNLGHKADKENGKQKYKVTEVGGINNPREKHFQKSSAGKEIKQFTPEEDQILIDAVEKFGDKIDIALLAKDLGRHRKSIGTRIEKVKTGKMGRVYRAYTFEEDAVILDAVLEHLNEQSIETLSLPNSTWKEVGDRLGRGYTARQRWVLLLQPWILQHYVGTFNLDIKRPLANYLADNFKDVNSIDWYSLASLPDFAGHTQASLRGILFHTLTPLTQRKLNIIGRQDITLRMIADVANTAFLPGRKTEMERNVKRQEEIVKYFESYVKSNCITNFLRQ